MSMIIAENLSHAFGPRRVLENISFRIGDADRIGLVGPNGEGKTTLLRIIAGTLESTGGQLHHRRGLRVGYLPQIPPALDAGTIHQAMLDVFADLKAMEQELHDRAGQLEKNKNDADLVARYGQLQAEYETRGGYDYPTRIEQVLTGLAFDRSMWDRPLTQLSGGQRTRVYLGTLLLRQPELLLLDEPTNHLDLDTVEWLEEWLAAFKGGLVVVSHDRFFLDRVTKDTWEVAFGKLETYHGAYNAYADQRELRFQERMRQWQDQQEYIAKTQDYFARYGAGQRARQARGRMGHLERFIRDEAIDRPQEHKTINIGFTAAGRTGDIVLRTEDLAIGYDANSPLLSAERLEVLRGDRVAIVGSNGTGKTTLLRALMGELTPLAGTVRLGANVTVGYLSQTHTELDPNITALNAVLAVKPKSPEQQARDILGSLLFNGDDVLKTIGQLSGGQRTRVALARLMMRNLNVLMLDEPTNHLDIASTEIMQEVLHDFTGTLIFVSHDRYLVQAVATHIWAIDTGILKPLSGGWQDFLAWRNAHRLAVEIGSAARKVQKEKDQRKTDYRQTRRDANAIQRLRKRHEEIESAIQQLEDRLAAINQGISQASQIGNLPQVEKLSREYQQADAELKALWNEWETVGQELEEKIQSNEG